MKQLDRMLFAQGGECFFCRKPLEASEASVEHLVAAANGGNNHEDNCVVCCKTLNALMGSKPLKEKIQVVLNQKGKFRCPADLERERRMAVAQSSLPEASASASSPSRKPATSKPTSPFRIAAPTVASKLRPAATVTPQSATHVEVPRDNPPSAAPLARARRRVRDVACPNRMHTVVAIVGQPETKYQHCGTAFRH